MSNIVCRLSFFTIVWSVLRFPASDCMFHFCTFKNVAKESYRPVNSNWQALWHNIRNRPFNFLGGWGFVVHRTRKCFSRATRFKCFGYENGWFVPSNFTTISRWKQRGQIIYFLYFQVKLLSFFYKFWRQEIIKKNILSKMKWSITKIVLSTSRH